VRRRGRKSDGPRRRLAQSEIREWHRSVQEITVIGGAEDLAEPSARELLQQHGALVDVRFAGEQLVDACACEPKEQVFAGAHDPEKVSELEFGVRHGRAGFRIEQHQRVGRIAAQTRLIVAREDEATVVEGQIAGGTERARRSNRRNYSG
jgi:hypothetical protein